MYTRARNLPARGSNLAQATCELAVARPQPVCANAIAIHIASKTFSVGRTVFQASSCRLLRLAGMFDSIIGVIASINQRPSR